jgi:hypothetical protein
MNVFHKKEINIFFDPTNIQAIQLITSLLHAFSLQLSIFFVQLFFLDFVTIKFLVSYQTNYHNNSNSTREQYIKWIILTSFTFHNFAYFSFILLLSLLFL